MSSICRMHYADKFMKPRYIINMLSDRPTPLPRENFAFVHINHFDMVRGYVVVRCQRCFGVLINNCLINTSAIPFAPRSSKQKMSSIYFVACFYRTYITFKNYWILRVSIWFQCPLKNIFFLKTIRNSLKKSFIIKWPLFWNLYIIIAYNYTGCPLGICKLVQK